MSDQKYQKIDVSLPREMKVLSIEVMCDMSKENPKWLLEPRISVFSDIHIERMFNKSPKLRKMFLKGIGNCIRDYWDIDSEFDDEETEEVSE